MANKNTVMKISENIVFCLLMAILFTMVDSSSDPNDCRNYTKMKLEKMNEIKDKITKIMINANGTISNSTMNFRRKAKDYVKSALSDLKKTHKIPPNAELRDSFYFDKVLNDASSRIQCCDITERQLFEKFYLFELPQELEEVIPELKRICYELSSWYFSLLMILREDKYVSRVKASVKLIQKYYAYVKMDKDLIVRLRKSMDSCANEAIEHSKNSVANDLEYYSDLPVFEESINWKPPQC